MMPTKLETHYSLDIGPDYRESTVFLSRVHIKEGYY